MFKESPVSIKSIMQYFKIEKKKKKRERPIIF